MTREEIADFLMKYSEGKSGLTTVGSMMEQLVFFLSRQQELIEELQIKVKVLEKKQ